MSNLALVSDHYHCTSCPAVVIYLLTNKPPGWAHHLCDDCDRQSRDAEDSVTFIPPDADVRSRTPPELGVAGVEPEWHTPSPMEDLWRKP